MLSSYCIELLSKGSCGYLWRGLGWARIVWTEGVRVLA